ncbi:MAG: epoxyqueuosine reductase [Candidatus Hydrogenedentota bacterium]|nr:MAG: epoxyqueuosine reductase [Candidatus Hydrogenedentota bacterium]
MTNDLLAELSSNGADMVGFADLHAITEEARHGFPRGVAIAVALNADVISGIRGGPTREYYADCERANNLLDSLSQRAARFLEEHGNRARSFAATDVGIDFKTHSTRLPHKTVATRAGLGWIGKCALLVTEKFGSAVRLATVVTDAELSTGDPIDESRCGDCSACVDVCPGRAPYGRNWEIGLYRDHFFDPWACRKAARKLAAERAGILETLCGICIAACPWTQRYTERSASRAD